MSEAGAGTGAETGTASRPLTRPERLDRLPFTRKHGRLLGGAGIGWALDALDVGLLSFVIAALRVQWDAEVGSLGLVASVGFAGMAIGAALGGLLADRIGRKQVFALTLLVYGLATGASALATGVGMLIALRFLVGLGLGAELPVASTLVSEFAPKKIRGRVIVVLESFWAIGWIAAALIGFLVIPGSDDGWRWALALGAIPAAWAIVVRWGLPESVRFLDAKGRHEQAERVVREFEESAGVPAPAETAPTPESTSTGGIRELFHDGRTRRTIAIWVVWFTVNFSYYGAFTWLPSILVAEGYDLLTSFGYVLLITLAQLPGYALSAWLIEAWGRRATLAAFLAGSVVSAVAFGFGAVSGSEVQIVVSGMLMSLCNLGAWGALYAVTPELYPTRLRATGSGWAAGVGRIASILAPLTVAPLIAVGGTTPLFVLFAVVFAVAAAAALFLPELKGTSLVE
ncbi:MFS transporter [Agromyces seonyuensis]|uniref:MFS transporter n=1 Tax=Agromyces seonyuensis TaxID=2662446 RepID=A0A6I4NUE0_9MICO|nr:MFS transporter [Agromyces seonyuensis]MWB98066.1 MFS transporter [Agromyces seonyuensis]